MSKSKIITQDAFYKMKAGQTVFLIHCNQFGQRKVVAEMLPAKPRLHNLKQRLDLCSNASMGLGNWPVVYPIYKLFWTRRAAQHYLETVVNLRPDALNVVNRVRPKKLD